MFPRVVPIIALCMLILVAGCSFVTGSGNVITEERPIDNFDSVRLRTDADITIQQGEQTFLTIRGEDNILERIETNVRRGQLVIDSRRVGISLMTILRNTEPVEITLSTPNIEEVHISGSGTIYSEELKTERMEVSVSGSGDIAFDALESDTIDATISGSGNIEIDTLTADSVDIQISGSGNVIFSGQAEQADMGISGSGDISVGKLAVGAADVRVSGSGEITTWVEESLDVHISGSGDVDYYGSPQVDQRITGSGDVTSLGAKE